MSTPIRVLIVDDDALVRAGLSMMLGGAQDIAVVGEAADGSEVLAAVDLHRPDVILLDLRMPGLDGLGAWELLAARAYKSADIFAGVILLGGIGLVANAALSLVEARALRWR